MRRFDWAAALLVIDHPDERAAARSEFDHMHAWGTRAEMEALKRLLEDLLGNGRDHVVTDGYVCPHCGAVPSPLPYFAIRGVE